MTRTRLISTSVFLSLFITLFSCSEEKDKQGKDLRKMDFETEINNHNYTVQKLSDYVESLRYVPLETNDNSLIDGGLLYTDYIRQYNKNDFFFFDGKRVLKFDSSGKYVLEIGTKGQGPNEYTAIRSVDIDFNNDRIYLVNRAVSVIEYTLAGEVIRSTHINNSLEDCFVFGLGVPEPGSYAFEVRSQNTNKYMLAFFDNINDEFALKELIADPNPFQKIRRTYSTAYSFYRTNDDLFFYQDNQADTIYSVKNQSIIPAYYFNYGKYGMPRNESDIDVDNRTFIENERLLHTNKFLFMKFFFNTYSPEPFKEEVMRNGFKFAASNTSVYSIFDKTSGDLRLLKQFKRGSLGLLNDIDNGLPFWPSIASIDGDEVAMICPADKFIETYSSLSNPSDEIKKVLEVIDEESNPVVIIAKLKR
ncbi:6-bladed beta-propeller [Parabacteroides sp. OttesenSCG-928-G07]|nr:6-bladed beta-propeller [Parabacteroides sp. OttesenSCG-928-G21]MDL2278032.1 6-bladed beta-propeller [Parabacteroides sp. OttesenSCG-928-G07]